MAKREEEVLEGEVVAPGDLSALAVINSSEIDQQVATAKKYPRSVKKFLNEARELVTLTEEVAGDCIFALPRGKENGVQKFIEGASVRFSEIIVSSWGNARCGSRPMGEEKGFITAQGYFFDLEKNVAIMTEVRRRITGKDGKRFNDDMIGVTVNAACSIARRNAILQGIPKALWKELYDDAKKTAIGDAKTLVKKRTEMMQYFQKMNVTVDTILQFLGVKGVEDIGIDELTLLRGIATAIKEGTTTIEKAFVVEEGERNGKAKEVFERLKNPSPDASKKEEKQEEAEKPVDKTAACAECGISDGHDPGCSKSTAIPCQYCKKVGGHESACPMNEPEGQP